MSNIVSKATLTIDEHNQVIFQPVHVINVDAEPYLPIIFTVEQLTDGKVEFEHDGMSNWSHKEIPKT